MDKKVETMEYRVLKVNHQKMVDALAKAVQYQRNNPTLIHYSLSRTWFHEDPENPEQEIWMFMDEAKNHDAYASSMVSSQEDTQAAGYMQHFKDMVIPGSSPLKHTVWEEIPELHVELDEG